MARKKIKKEEKSNYKEPPFKIVKYEPPITVICIDANRYYTKGKYLENDKKYECRYEMDTGTDVLLSIKVAESGWKEFSADRFKKGE